MLRRLETFDHLAYKDAMRGELSDVGNPTTEIKKKGVEWVRA